MAITEFRDAQNAGIGMKSIRVFARVSWLLSKRVEWSPSFSALLIAWLASSFKGTVDVTNSYAGNISQFSPPFASSCFFVIDRASALCAAALLRSVGWTLRF
ncbi:hypothetical protein SAY86_007998 [Trapa natans]|uniref:Uncharacterized protein n=1 Tax=Trapa natans TaxID=22666 RepID=A0AAN7LFH1_TRANT|nr:hypothetical protein SAY86_007998 [Trapa natans]